jgi:sorbitol-specific phosphotransferase system component IIC
MGGVDFGQLKTIVFIFVWAWVGKWAIELVTNSIALLIYKMLSIRSSILLSCTSIDREATRTIDASPRFLIALLQILPLIKLSAFSNPTTAYTTSASPLSCILTCFVVRCI